jgi:hypothetical protein
MESERAAGQDREGPIFSVNPSGFDVRAALRARMVESCERNLSKAFVWWLLLEPQGRAEFVSIVAAAGKRKGAAQDFQTIAILGFAADANLLSAPETAVLKEGLIRLAGRSPVINGMPMGFSSDPVGVLGIAVGTAAIADREITKRIADWAARFLKSSYERERAQDWERCLFAAADRKMGPPVGLPIPASVAAADVRLALLSVDALDHSELEPQQDAMMLKLSLAEQELPEDFGCERTALRLKALEWGSNLGSRTSTAGELSSNAVSKTETLRNGPDVHLFWVPYWTGGILLFRNEGIEAAKNVRLRSSTEAGWRPILRPKLVASISPGATARVMDETAQTPVGRLSIADFVHSLPSKKLMMTVVFEDRLGEKRERDFRVVAAGKDAMTESAGVAFYAEAFRKIGTSDQAAKPQNQPSKTHNGKTPVKANAKYQEIYRKLKEISAARPKNHEEVFGMLDKRQVSTPNSKVFKSGWLRGFEQNPHGASAWLSQNWSRLELPPFSRGPKK